MRLSGKGPLDGIGMTMEAGEVADEAAPGVAVRLTADRAEVARRAVSLMVETIDADQNSRAAMMVRCSTMDF